MESDRGASAASSMLVSVGDDLREEVRRVAAAADCAVVEPDAPPGRRLWTQSSRVVLDAAAADACADGQLPRRAGVLVVTSGEPGLDDWRAATAVGAEDVIGLPEHAARLVAAVAPAPGPVADAGAVLVVVGGRGGAGASTFAAALAATATADSRDVDCLLVDGDPDGGGLDVLLGIESVPGMRWPGLVADDGRVSARALHDALPRFDDRVAVLACGRGSTAADPGESAVQAVLDAGRGSGDLIVCDAGRGRGSAADPMLASADLVALVVPAELRAVAAAETVLERLRGHGARCGVVVRGPAPGGLRGPDVADALNLPLLAQMRPEYRIGEVLDRGGFRLRRRGPLRSAARSVLDQIVSDTAAAPRSGRFAS
ncbi:MAG TPA: septum site-determining protein Ssd [Aldersonia sp.]